MASASHTSQGPYNAMFCNTCAWILRNLSHVLKGIDIMKIEGRFFFFCVICDFLVSHFQGVYFVERSN